MNDDEQDYIAMLERTQITEDHPLIQFLNRIQAQPGDLVETPFKNRWGLPCAGTVISVTGDTATVEVWNMLGPGGDHIVNGIPLSELKPT